MPRDVSGNYALPAGNPVASGTVISSTWANATMPDLGNEITNSLDRSGRGGMLVPFQNVDGTVISPGITFTTEPASGLYKAATTDIRFSIAGSDTVRFIDATAQTVGEQEPFQIWNGSSWEAPLTDFSTATFGVITVEANASNQAIKIVGNSANDRGQIEFFENDGTTRTFRIDSDDLGVEFRSVTDLKLLTNDNTNTGVHITPDGAIQAANPGNAVQIKAQSNPFSVTHRRDVNTLFNGVGETFTMQDANSDPQDYARIVATIIKNDVGAAEGAMSFFATVAGDVAEEIFKIGVAGAEVRSPFDFTLRGGNLTVNTGGEQWVISTDGGGLFFGGTTGGVDTRIISQGAVCMTMTGANLAVAGDLALAATNPLISNAGVGDGVLTISGGTSKTSGANVQYFGASHATRAADAEWRFDSTVWMSFDKSALRLKYQGIDVQLSAARKLYFDGGSNTYIHEVNSDSLQTVVGGTTMQIIDQDTGLTHISSGSLQIDGGNVILNGNNGLLRNQKDGLISMSGSDTDSTGANVQFWGETSSNPSDTYFRAGTQTWLWHDASGTPATTFEASGELIINLQAGAASKANLNFGDPADPNVGFIRYDNSTDQFEFRTGAASQQMELNNSALTLNSSIDLTLQEGSRINFSTGGGTYITEVTPFHIEFFVASSERIDINTNSMFVKTVTAGQPCLIVEHPSATTPFGMKINFTGGSPDDNSQLFLQCVDTVTNRCLIYSDGDVWTADAGFLTSDRSLKTNIVDATPKLEDVLKLRTRNFEWTEEYHPAKVGEKKIGFIDDEFAEVFPGLVSEHATVINGEETTKNAIRYGALIPILVSAIQELEAQVKDLTP